ncbi:MAG: coproporphyrinogen III oxidase [Rhodobacteraceae bacterium]|nr:coproporphyrinogen III oxidase [Paracoccaceae bacterium]
MSVPGGFALYLHWPFCAAKCPYCDFNSHVRSHVDHDRWQRAYLAEIDRAAAETGGRVLGSVFLGGGTPSLMPPDLVAALLERVRACWTLAPGAEITLEANPTSVEAGRFRGFAEAGVNRVSMGVQSFIDDDLRALGRMHSAAEARAAFDIARAHFARVSFDLIYARQNQTPEGWRQELQAALEMAVDHLSLYQLTIEEGTAFGSLHARGRLRGLPDEDRAADMWEITQEACAAAGLPAYEISNHARPGAESRHNLVYWRGGDWLGIGPGAHGRLTLGGQRLATDTLRAPEDWLSAVEQHGSGERPRAVIPPEEQATEYLLMAARLAEGVDLKRLSMLSGSIDETRAAGMAADGLLEIGPERLRVTAAGRPILNAVLRALLPDHP